LTSEEPPIVGTIDDMCRGDDKVRCGTTSVYICDVQKCDGTVNCPNGEDEENCPSSQDPEPEVDEDEESGESGIFESPRKETPEEKVESDYGPEEDIEPEVKTSDGDLLFIFFTKIEFFFDSNFSFQYLVDIFYLKVFYLSY
jgi:hypothetical protein